MIAHDGVILFNLIVAGVLTLILGAVALLLLQRAILRNMAAAAGMRRIDAPPPAERPRRAAAAPLVLAVDDTATAAPSAGLAGRILTRMLVAHALAGLVFGVLAALLLLPMGGMQLLPLRTAVIIWALAWPTVLVLGLLVGPDRRAQGSILLGYLAGLLILCSIAWLMGISELTIAGVTVPGFFQPAVIWAIYALPSLYLLLFLNRTIRTIGPLVLVFVFVALIGSHLALTVLTLEPVTKSALELAVAIGIGGVGLFWGVAGLGMIAGIWPAWRSVAFLRDRYAAKHSSELLITISAIWLLQALSLADAFFRSQGAIAAAAAIVPLLGWRLALYGGLRSIVADARTRPPRRLLLLRVFGFGRRSRRLFDLIGARWRVLGSIDLIAAPDLASRTIEPSTFLEFVRGRLGRLFIHTPTELEERLAAIDERPDPDARFRVNQLFCSDDMWKQAVTRLMGEASLVVMDLRGFGPQRRGCVFELQTLLDAVPLGRLLFLFDGTTDRGALEKLLQEHWQQLDLASPNLASSDATLRLLDVSGGDANAVRRLLAIAESVPRVQESLSRRAAE